MLRIIGGAIATCLLVPFYVILWVTSLLFLPLKFFVYIGMPFGVLIIRLIKEEANRDGARLVQGRILFKQRELIPPYLKEPYPPCREWLKTAPRWVGEAVEENPRYRLWMGFLDTALFLSREALGIEKKPVGHPFFGKSGPASDDDLRKAGLL